MVWSNDSKKIHVASHRLTDLKCMYFWLLQSVDTSKVWNPADLGRIADLLTIN